MQVNLSDPVNIKPHAELLDDEKLWRIGELAQLTGATTRTLRYYEELELLQPARNRSGQRLYGQSALTRLNFINELKSGGFSLLDIKNLFDSWQKNTSGSEAANSSIKLIHQKITEISELQQKLNKLNDELRGLVSYLLACKTCNHKPNLKTCSDCDQHLNQDRHPVIMSLLKDGEV